MSLRTVAVMAAVVADRALGEPPSVIHPVARFGQAMAALETRMWADSRAAGVTYASIGVGGAGLVGWQLARRQQLIGVALTTYVAVAGRALAETASVVAEDLVVGDMAKARVDLRSLVGRDPTQMDEKEVVRAVVESIAENSVDAVTAPLFWALVGGAPAVAAYRAMNTLDAMVGHHNPRYEKFGWAAARLDDVANWMPSRLTAVAVACVRPARALAVWRAVRNQAPDHPSPNAGVAEAAFAAALDIRLGGTNDYAGRVEVRPQLGSGPPPEKEHIEEALRLSRDVTVAFVAVALMIVVGWRRR